MALIRDVILVIFIEAHSAKDELLAVMIGLDDPSIEFSIHVDS
jgi:hypothetical protein